jgi:dynamin 1-like protein
VLSSIIGIDFMPKGDGVVTRRPLELRLNHLNDRSAKPWGIFPDEIPGKKFYNFDEVRDSIIALTDKVCGSNKGIVDKPIVLNVHSPTCPDLTMVDLPGITRIAIAGQAENIE